MKKLLLFSVLLLLASFRHSTCKAQINLTLSADKAKANVSPMLYGIFFEDINRAADGGLYGELIRNRSFEDDANNAVNWSSTTQNGSVGTIALEKNNLLNAAQTNAIKLTITNAANGRVGFSNGGFWGIPVVNAKKYILNFFAKANSGFNGTLTITLENTNGSNVYAQQTISGLSASWNKYSCTLTANGNDPNARLVITTKTNGTIWFDVVSLFPPTFKNQPNGLRPDIAQMIADMHPKFNRFPGGCFIEGEVMAESFRWKQTIGPIETRPGHPNIWGYRTTDGMGFHEFLQFSEDIGAEPLYVANCGLSHKETVPLNQMDIWVQDVLDAIEYANGDASTVYGAKRIANGHATPFNLKYIEIGNENNLMQSNYEPRYKLMYDAIKNKYPQINCIANSLMSSAKTDYIDEHYYNATAFFQQKYSLYDAYDRKGPKIYCGEYAVTDGCGNGNLNAALGESAFMSGMEKNSDIVLMSSYAPLLSNVNDKQWNPDAINYNASKSYGTPSYYAQKMFATNIGDVIIPAKDQNNCISNCSVNGRIGLGTWATKAEFKNVTVTSDTSTLFSDNFSGTSNWTPSGGTWAASSGSYIQSSTNQDCHSIAANINHAGYVYHLTAKKQSGNEGFLIIFGYQDPNNFYWWNIGGWGNTANVIERSVNGTKSTLSRIPGSINANQWYDIRIEINDGEISCYLDNVLTNKISTEKYLYYSATQNSASKEMFVKITNTTNASRNATVAINGIGAAKLNGTAMVMKSGSDQDENSINTPNKIIPQTTTVSNLSSTFQYTFPAYSLTVLKLIPDNITGIKGYSENGIIKIYPNPVTDGVLTIDLSEQKSEQVIELFVNDILGKSVLKKEIKGNSIFNLSTETFQNGIYFIHLKGEKLDTVQKIIIQN